jgi:2-oxo-4-hydroxy-4-carboxy-5-ureidoimidazoline decarboxylase
MLNDLSLGEARTALVRCCGSSAWVASMLRARPFRDQAHLLATASRVWRELSADDWHEAFSHHPRIGEGDKVPSAAQATTAWAKSEQAGASAAELEVKQALADGNRAYEAKFGHIYLVCASGKSGTELLAILRARMDNDPAAELRVAAGEQEKITQLRLLRLLGENAA